MSAPVPFRVIDTGLREGRAQIAFDQALIDLHDKGAVPDTIRFLRFPPTVLIGRHQALASEVKLDHVRGAGIGLVRRVTGGGAIYLDEGQLGWEIIFRRRNLPRGTLGDYAQVICEAVAGGLSQSFGIEARFRPRNDIEVGGRKLCGTGGFFYGGTLFYQGTVLVDMDPQAMVACLNVPEAKLIRHGLDSAAKRVVTLKELLGDAPAVPAVQQAVIEGLERILGIEARPGAITAAEEAAARQAFETVIGRDAFVHEIDDPGSADVLTGTRSGSGGTVTAYLRLEGPRGHRIREILFTGDFFLTPPRLVFDLEAALRGVPLARADETVMRFFADNPAEMLTITPEDFCAALEAAAAQVPAAASA